MANIIVGILKGIIKFITIVIVIVLRVITLILYTLAAVFAILTGQTISANRRTKDNE